MRSTSGGVESRHAEVAIQKLAANLAPGARMARLANSNRSRSSARPAHLFYHSPSPPRTADSLVVLWCVAAMMILLACERMGILPI